MRREIEPISEKINLNDLGVGSYLNIISLRKVVEMLNVRTCKMERIQQRDLARRVQH